MQLSIETYAMRHRFGDETAIKMIKDAGFDAFDYSFYYEEENSAINLLNDNYDNQAKRLREYADGIGISCNQAHAPFCFDYNDTFDISNNAYKKIVRSIHSASILGAKNIIVHCRHRLPLDVDFTEYNYIFYKHFEEYCEKYNICISVENLFTSRHEPVLSNPYQMTKFIQKLDSPYFNVCCDVGHAAITGFEPATVILGFDNNTLKALHIQDNDYKHDSHMLPFVANLKWDEIATALKKIEYEGDFTFEISSFFKNYPDDFVFEALKFAEKTGRYIISKITK